MVAGCEAVVDAGLDMAAEDRERFGVVLGTGIGGIDVILDPIGRMYSQESVRVTLTRRSSTSATWPRFTWASSTGASARSRRW